MCDAPLNPLISPIIAPLATLHIGFTVTSYAVSRGHPAPLVGKRFLAGGFRVYFCLDSCLVYINFAHIQDHDYVRTVFVWGYLWHCVDGSF